MVTASKWVDNFGDLSKMKAVLHIYIEFDGMETSLSFKHAFHSYLHVFQGHEQVNNLPQSEIPLKYLIGY